MPEKRELDSRPSPEALLAEARRQERGGRGRLKIFVGAAPGVGKTYEMLHAARAKIKEGVDVVVGLVETHGRIETATLVEGLEVIPRKQIPYGGRVLEEFDLDAALQRRPSLILVDELAHTNVVGSRHPKRYLDIEELLAAGIDVYTTVNIQHIESLNDVVAQITRVRVRETVPDAVLDEADAIELVDLTPDDLIQRLKEGKVYVPQQAERALRHYFSPPNLTALRELALRRTAERVDEQLLEHMQAKAIAGPWAAGERILVCVNEDEHSISLVRYAKRLADRLKAPWTALYIETPRSLELGEAEKRRIAGAQRLAERSGGEAITLPTRSARIADDIIVYAQRNNFTQVIVGKPTRSWWAELFGGSVVRDLLRRSGNVAIHVLAGEVTPERPGAKFAAQSSLERLDPIPYLTALAAVGAALSIGLLARPHFGIENVDLVFLTAIVGVAVRYGVWPSLFASVVASLCYNFFFLPPIYTFTITDPTNIAAFVLFSVLSIVVSNLAARGRSHALAAHERLRSVEQLYGFSRKLAGAGSLDDVLWATAHQIAAMLRLQVVLLLPEDGTIAVKAGYPPEDQLDDADLAAAKWAWEKQRPAGRDSDTLPGAKWLFLPMRTGRGPIGILGISREGPGPLIHVDQQRLIDALADQGALAIERVNLVENFERARRLAETDRLRTALLTSISHDLKTPLASVIGSAEALRDLSSSLDEKAKADLAATIIEEAERLNRFIANLLDMTKLESGAVLPTLAPHDIGDVVGSTLHRMDRLLAGRRVDIDIAPNLPMVQVDPLLLEQALFNILDNANKYAKAGTALRIQSWLLGDTVHIQVLDEGPGIPDADLERIFDKFYRIEKADQVRAGTGLGLAIARGFVEGMKGTIKASNRTDKRGAVFTITLPAQPVEQRAEVAA
jgi:two-component system sensor histidine kinase KdpD